MKKMKNIKGDGPNAIRGALKGALKGALTGGAAGSVGGAGGAFIGGVSGAVIGGVSGSRKENNIQRSINVANAASAMAEHEAKVANSTPAPVVEDAPVVDPVQDELSRQAREVASGNVNSAQADYFKQQNPNLPYNKIEKMTRVNPVSNREDKMTKLFGGLYGSEESRGIL